MAKKLNDYSCQDMQGFIRTISELNEKAQSDAIEVISNDNYDGDDFAGALEEDNPKAELKDMGFKGHICPKILKHLQLLPRNKPMTEEEKMNEQIRKNNEEKKKREEKENNDCNNNGGNSNNIKNDSNSYKIRYFETGKYYESKHYFTNESTIAQVSEHLLDIHYGGKGYKELEIIYKKDVVSSTQTLGQIKYQKQLFFTVSKKCRGGSVDDSKFDNKKENPIKQERERFPDFSNKNIQPSYKPDCIMGYRSKKQLRVEMPCKHVFAPKTIYKIAEMDVGNDSKDDIHCPIVECDEIWNLEDVMSAADLEQNDIDNFSRILNNRKLVKTGDYRPCPKCTNLLKKGNDVKILRVRCGEESCQKERDFCWMCGKTWLGGGFTFCGNEGCWTDEINNILKDCKMIMLDYGSNYKKECPSMRACPRCYCLITYQTACKHMTCWKCNKKFCFFCLSLYDDNKWGCKEGGSASKQCDIAGRQHLK